MSQTNMKMDNSIARLFGAGLAVSVLFLAAPVLAVPVAVSSQVIEHFDRLQPHKVRFGKLEWIGGLELSSSSNSDFGGFSSFEWTGPSQFLALSDRGYALSATLEMKDDRPKALSNADMELLPDLRRRRAKWNRDSEGLSLYKGKAYVSFEGDHRVATYDFSKGRVGRYIREVPLPKKVLASVGGNKGIEAVAHGLDGSVHAGSMVLFSERAKNKRLQGWLFDKRGQVFGFQLPQHDDFLVTDAAFLSNGDLIVLERDFSLIGGLFIQMRRVRVVDLKAGMISGAEVIFEASFRQELDNMEGLGVQALPNGDSLLTLISDDNFNALQRTLLLQFRLPAAS